MDLDAMKQNWGKLNDEIEKQKNITDKLILEMTKDKYQRKMQRIIVPELIGGIICFAAAIYTLLNFDKLDTWYFQICGTIFLISMIFFPILVLRSIFSMKDISIEKNSSKEVVSQFIKKRKNLLFVQKLTMISNFFLVFTTLPVTSKILNDENIFLEPTKLLLFALVMGIFLFFFSRWAIGCLKRSTQNMQTMLEGLES